jgi:thioredoxin-related protein
MSAFRGGLWSVLAGAAVVASAAGRAGAEEVQWRGDYRAARREASEKNRPLVLVFGTAHCAWCRKLETDTLRDPSVTGLLNEHFIPLAIDADQNAALAQALHVQTYPTLVFAAPDGKILGTREGFVDATAFRRQLRQVLEGAGR